MNCGRGSFLAGCAIMPGGSVSGFLIEAEIDIDQDTGGNLGEHPKAEVTGEGDNEKWDGR